MPSETQPFQEETPVCHDTSVLHTKLIKKLTERKQLRNFLEQDFLFAGH